MRPSRRSVRLLLLVTLLAGAPLLPTAGCARIDPGSELDGARYWPDGNATAGLQAFKDLKCYHCHKVKSVPEIAVLNEEPLGPALDSATAKRSRMDILVQIVAPGSDPAIQESHMGNFDEVMTVAQLTDLIAFIESLHI